MAQVPMPLVPWYCSLHSAPSIIPHCLAASENEGSPKKSSTTPSRSVSNTEKPDPDNCWYSVAISPCAIARKDSRGSCLSLSSRQSRMTTGTSQPGSRPKSRTHRFHDWAIAGPTSVVSLAPRDSTTAFTIRACSKISCLSIAKSLPRLWKQYLNQHYKGAQRAPYFAVHPQKNRDKTKTSPIEI